MPSVLLGFTSGGCNILSGNYFSGLGTLHPVGGVQLTLDRSASGSVYVALSGKLTINSGGLNASGFPNFSGAMDGVQIAPGGAYFVPRIGIGPSSGPTLFVNPDANCSGQARIFWEVY